VGRALLEDYLDSAAVCDAMACDFLALHYTVFGCAVIADCRLAVVVLTLNPDFCR